MHEFNHEKLMTTSSVGHCTPYDSIKYGIVLQTMNRIKHIVIENYS